MEIAELVNTNIRREWESDIAEQEDHEEGTWLASLPIRRWRLDVLPMKAIRLSERIMNYHNSKTGYSFRQRLGERMKILERDLDRYSAVIRPLVVREEDGQLMDGYCRYHVLLDKKAGKAYAYIGASQPSPESA